MTYLILFLLAVGTLGFLGLIAFVSQASDRGLLRACPIPEAIPNHELALAAKELKFFYQDYERLPLAEQASRKPELDALIKKLEQARDKTQGDHQAYAQAGEAWVTAWRDFDSAFHQGNLFSRSFYPNRMQDLQCFRSHYHSCERRYKLLAERLKSRDRIWLKEGQNKAQGLDLAKLTQELQAKGLFNATGGLTTLKSLLPQVHHFTLTEPKCDLSQLPQPLTGVSLSNSRLVGALIQGPATLQDCQLTEVDFSHSRLHHLTLIRCRLERVSLRQAQGQGLSLFQCEFIQCELAGLRMEECKLVEVKFLQSPLDPDTAKNCSLCEATRQSLGLPPAEMPRQEA